MERSEPSYTVGGNVNRYSHYGEKYGGSLKTKTELSYHPTVPLLGIYLERNMTRKDTCTLMFIAALFTIAKTGKQPKCPPTKEWIKKMWYTYTMEYCPAFKKNKIMPFSATCAKLKNIVIA